MILQSLREYYERKKNLGEIAPDGFIEKRIEFLIELDEDGTFLGLSDLREPVKKGFQGKTYYVPAIGSQASKHSNAGTDANLLWDKSAFVLGANSKKGKEFESFKSTIHNYYENPPTDVAAVLKFLDRYHPFTELLQDEKVGEILSTGAPIVSFRIRGSVNPIVSAPHVEAALVNYIDSSALKGTCMVSGNYGIIDPTHPVIKGAGGQPSGCSLIGVNAPSYCSYGKKQSYNSPIIKETSSAYTKALQSLINSDNKTTIADITVLSWIQNTEIEEANEVYAGYVPTVKDPPKDDPDRGATEIKALMDSVKTGKYRKKYLGNFYVLGLAPNSARLAVKYWDTGPVYVLAERLAQHFEDFEIVRHPDAREYLTLGQILRSTVFEAKMSNVPSNLAGEVVRSVLTGNPYPRTLFLQTLRRIRSERKVTRARAAIIKAYVNRKKRIYKEEGELTMSLDINNPSIGYRLGRLFAVLEKIQNTALPDINASICDRYYGAASSTPATVFPQLMKLKNHHIAKLSPQYRVFNEKLIGEIMSEISLFPRILDIDQQGLFAIGYYHQKQDFYIKKDSKNETDATDEINE